MLEDFEIVSDDESGLCLSSSSYILPDTEKIWVKLCADAVSVLDKFYRELDGGSATSTSPFYIYTKHRFYKDYFEFYKMEYDQIYEHHNYGHEILSPEEMEERFGEEVQEEQLSLE